jgi:hypothetical protein
MIAINAVDLMIAPMAIVTVHVLVLIARTKNIAIVLDLTMLTMQIGSIAIMTATILLV